MSSFHQRLQDTRSESKAYFEQKRLRIEAENKVATLTTMMSKTDELLDHAMKGNEELQSICDQYQARMINLHAYMEEIEIKLQEKYGITTEQLCDIDDAQAFV